MYVNIDSLIIHLNIEIAMCESYMTAAARGSDSWRQEERKKRLYEDVLEKVKWLPKLKEEEQNA